MPTRDGLRVAVALSLAVAALAAAGAGATAQDDCRAIDEKQVCVQDVSLSDDELVDGDRGEVSVTVENVGNETVAPAVVLNVVAPDNETGVYQIGQPTVAPGGTAAVSQPLNASTVGTHGLRVQLVDGETRGVYDASEAVTLEVLDEAPRELGGPIDRTEIALAALVLALVGMGALGYRRFRGSVER